MTKLNKHDLIKEVADSTEVPVNVVKQVINSFCNNISEHVLDGDEVSIKGLVHFYGREHSEKEIQDFKKMTRAKIGKRVLPDAKISRTIIDKYKNKIMHE